MKRFVWLSMLMPLLACCHNDKPLSAAEDFYLQNADREHVTVALIAGYVKNGETLNVVKMQAHDEETWRQLLKEFDVRVDTAGSGTERSQPSGVHRTTTFEHSESLLVVNGDTIRLGQDVDPLSAVSDMLDSMILNRMVTDTAVTIRHRSHYRHDTLVSDQCDTVGFFPDFNKGPRKRMIDMAHSHGNNAYGIFTDSENWTLWVVFYDTLEELFRISSNVLGYRD